MRICKFFSTQITLSPKKKCSCNKANDYAARLRLKKAIFKQATQTKKAVFTTLLTTYPALQNKYYLEEIESEITMDKLFER